MSLYDELLSEINKKVAKNKEEKQSNSKKKKDSFNLPTKRKAYNASESTRAITNNTSKSKVNLPIANEFKQQL